MTTNQNDPATAGCELEQAVIDYFDLDPIEVTEDTKIQTDFGHIVNILAMYREGLIPRKFAAINETSTLKQ